MGYILQLWAAVCQHAKNVRFRFCCAAAAAALGDNETYLIVSQSIRFSAAGSRQKHIRICCGFWRNENETRANVIYYFVALGGRVQAQPKLR